MNRKSGLLLAAIALAHGAMHGAEPRTTTLAQWAFDRPGDLEGWRPNAHLADTRVAAGVLHARGAGSDPILELAAPLDVPAAPRQALELRLKATRPGNVEFFWSNTTQGQYGGFSQDKSTRFPVLGDNQWHTYRVLPCWHAQGRIVRLRLDPYDGAEFDLDYLRIVQLESPPAAAVPEFAFPADAPGWQWIDSVSATPGLWLGPPVDFDATERACVSVCLAAAPEAGEVTSTLFFATTHAPGLHARSFPIVADGRERVYCLDLLDTPDWRGRVVALGLGFTAAPPPDAAPTPIPHPAANRISPPAGLPGLPRGLALHWLKVADEPQGPPRIDILAFSPETALPRTGLPFRLRARVANGGGGALTGTKVALDLPASVETLTITAPTPTPLGFQDEADWTWTLRSTRPIKGHATLRASADGIDSALARCPIEIAAPPPTIARGSIPPPQPVRGPTEVGVYYFPGWKSASQWQPIRRFPERQPVLGWYREGEPEVADWHIKWAVEHGITFFVYDWYWSQGARQLEHALHDGFLRARYRSYLKFCLLWANHNAPGTSSIEDCVAVTQYWIAQYFRQPEYFRVAGRPVVVIFSTDRLTADLGSAGVKTAFDTMRRVCRDAGLADLLLVACIGDASQTRQAAIEGYDAVSAYNWPGLGVPPGQWVAPYETLLPGYREHWQQILAANRLPLWLPLCGGWDSRPWHGDNNLVRFGRTPDLFRRHLLDARRLLASPGTPQENGLANIVLIEAWNEFGEGSYIEPHQEFGFGYLDALREVFTSAPPEHTDLTPSDVGLGPYDVPPLPPSTTAWDFAHNDEGWNQTMDLADVHVVDGALRARTTGNDPAFFGPPFQARAADFAAVEVRLRLERGNDTAFRDRAQLFWRTARLPEHEASSERFEVLVDGQWHTYIVPVASNRRWRGAITRLRLDPANQRDLEVTLDSIRLVKPTDPDPH